MLKIDINITASPSLIAALAALASSVTVAREPEKPETPQTPESTKTAEAKPPAAPPSQSSPAQVREITITEVRKAISALADKDRARAISLLTARGAQSVSTLKPEHYADVYREATQ